MSKQPPEESFKDQILRQLEEGTGEMPSPKDGKRSSSNAANNNGPSVGSRRSQANKPKASATKKTESKAKVAKKATNNKETKQVKATPKKTQAPKARAVAKDNVDPEMMQRKNAREQENRIVSKIVTVVVLALLAIGIVLAIFTVQFVRSGLQPLDPNDKKEVSVEIPSGSSNKQIGEILEKDKIIRNGMIFNYYTKFNNLTGFQAGTYKFSPSMELADIGKALQTGGAGTAGADVKLTIPEGLTVDAIGDLLAKETKITKKEFLDLVNDKDFFAKLQKAYPNLLDSAGKAKDVRYRLEGYLFPATYDYYKTSKLEDIVTKMVATTDQVMSNYYDQIKAKGMTVQQVLTLASLCEKEANKEADRKKIAQVFFNRFDADMPLQSDISVTYAMNKHKEQLTNKDTSVDSPYNLYIHKGYGPGPFNNPSEMSIQAVLEPTKNDYLYFVADVKTGKVYYAQTIAEHDQLAYEHIYKYNE